MESTEIIYPLDGDDVIPVKAEDVVCFRMEVTVRLKEKLLEIAVELKDGTLLNSNSYEPSEANNLLRTLLKTKDFVIVNRTDKPPFCQGTTTIRTRVGVRFLAVRKIGMHLEYVESNSKYSKSCPILFFRGKVVKSTAENYWKWKESQEEKNEI